MVTRTFWSRDDEDRIPFPQTAAKNVGTLLKTVRSVDCSWNWRTGCREPGAQPRHCVESAWFPAAVSVVCELLLPVLVPLVVVPSPVLVPVGGVFVPRESGLAVPELLTVLLSVVAVLSLPQLNAAKDKAAKSITLFMVKV